MEGRSGEGERCHEERKRGKEGRIERRRRDGEKKGMRLKLRKFGGRKAGGMMAGRRKEWWEEGRGRRDGGKEGWRTSVH